MESRPPAGVRTVELDKTAPTVDSGENPGVSARGSLAHERLEALFAEALGLNPDGRAALLGRLRQGKGDGDRQLAVELEALLAADAVADTALQSERPSERASERRSERPSERPSERQSERPSEKKSGPATDRDATDTVNLGAAAAALALDIPGYRVLRVLGEGGMGTVYAAEQESPRRKVAIKVLHARSPNALIRFRAEADIMARLDHPGIARVLEAGQAAGQPFLVMEHVEGVTLDRFVKQLGRRERLALFVELCDAIHHAHVKGVIHRDLKPSNVMVRPSGRVVVLDFGVARLASAHGSTPGDTRAGDLIGTPVYMSPEQARLQANEVDARSDVYTLGVMLYELLCDELPYDVRGLALPALTRLITEDEPRPLHKRVPELRGDLEAITLKALRKLPAERYQSAAAMGDDVRRFLDGLPVSVRSPGTLENFQRFVRRRPLVAATIGGALVAGATFAVVVTGLWLEASAARRTAESAQQRTEAARAELEARTNQLVLRQARAVVSRDPTEALAWLATLTARALDVESAWSVADEALGRGVAKQVWHAHRDEVHWVEPFVGPSGAGFASGGYDGQVVVFEEPALVARPLFQAGAGRVLMARPSPDGARLAIGGEDGALHVVTRKDAVPAALVGHEGELQSLAWSRDGARLVSGDDHGNIWLWPNGQAPGQHLVTLPASLGALELSAQGDALIAGSDDGTVEVWGLLSGNRTKLQIRGKPVGAWTDGTRALVVDGDGVVYGWHREAASPQRPSPGMVAEAPIATGVPIKRALFAAGGEELILGGVGGAVLRVALAAEPGRAAAAELLAGHRSQVRSIARSGDGALLATGADDGVIQVLDRRSGRRLTLLGHKARVRHLAFLDGASASGGTLVSGDGDGMIRRWELPRTPSVLDAGGAAIVSAVASPDGGELASVNSDGEVVRWSLAIGGRMRLGKLRGQLSALAIADTPSGSAVLTGTLDGKVTWWWSPPGEADGGGAHRPAGADGGRGAPVVRSVPGIVKDVRAGSSGRIAVASSSGALALFSASGLPLSEVPAHVDGADTVAWHPSGRLLASGGQDRKVRLWRVEDEIAPVQVAALEGLTGDTHFLAFSPSGDRLFAADDDGLVASWRLRDGAVDPRSLVILARHGGAISAMALSRDGHYLATSALDKSFTRVDLTTDVATVLPFGDVATALTFDQSNNLYAVTRTGAVGRATTAGAALLLDHGATTGAAIPPGQLAIALDDGAVLISPLQARSFAELRSALEAATSYQLPEASK